MTEEMFSVFDMVAERFLTPFFGMNIGTAIRGFGEVCQDKEHQFGKYPEDYALYHIGTFDGEMGAFTTFEPRKIAMASSYTHGTQLALDIEDHDGLPHKRLEELQ